MNEAEKREVAHPVSEMVQETCKCMYIVRCESCVIAKAVSALETALYRASKQTARLVAENTQLSWQESTQLDELQRKRDREIGEMGGGG